MAAGGDYLLETLPLFDYEFIRNHPKWIQGFSDPTGLFPASIACHDGKMRDSALFIENVKFDFCQIEF